MNPNTVTPVNVGTAWTAADPFLPPDGGNLVAIPTRTPIDPGVNSPDLTGIGWRREIYKLWQVKRIR